MLQAQWLVNGIPLGTFAQQLAFVDAVTLDSRRAIPLPTMAPGEHFVTLRILSPRVSFLPPQIRYYVREGSGGEPPRVDAVTPAAVRPGEEADLTLSGRLRPGMGLSFGKDVALVAPLRFMDPSRAIARIFVAPTARAGYRPAEAFDGKRRSRGPGWLQVLPRPAARIATTEALPWPGFREPRPPSLLRTLTAFFLVPQERATLFP